MENYYPHVHKWQNIGALALEKITTIPFDSIDVPRKSFCNCVRLLKTANFFVAGPLLLSHRRRTTTPSSPSRVSNFARFKQSAYC